MTPILKIDDLHVSYGDVPVLHGVDVAAAEGEIVAVVGANGAGKTTLMSTIAGLLRPTKGTITFRGSAIAGKPAHRVTDMGLAMVPEGGRLFPFMTVEENLQLGGYSKRVRATNAARIAEMMDLFPILGERRGQLAGKLSGGERQMCAIARAVMSRPSVLLLDEPSVGLSPLMVERVFDIVRSLAEREHLTILLVEQNVGEALEIASQAYVLSQGSIVRKGPAAELINDKQIQESYMGL